MKILRMSGDAFNAAVLATQMRSTTTIDAARAVLVEGRTRMDAAKDFCVTRGCVNAAVKTIGAAYIRQAMGGNAVIAVELEAPERLVFAFDAFAKSIIPGDDTDRVDHVIRVLEDNTK